MRNEAFPIVGKCNVFLTTLNERICPILVNRLMVSNEVHKLKINGMIQIQTNEKIFVFNGERTGI